MIKNEFAKNLVEVDSVTYDDMKQEWNDKESKKVERVIRNLFTMKTLTNHRNEKRTMYTFNHIEDFFGLPYTSSSSFAMLGNTNTRFCFDAENEFNIDCFALGNDNNVYVWCSDAEENELVYKVV